MRKREGHSGAGHPALTERERFTVALKFLEEAADRGARSGAMAEDMLQGMLSIYVTTRMGFGSTPEAVLAEVSRLIEFTKNDLAICTVEEGPPLGRGDN